MLHIGNPSFSGQAFGGPNVRRFSITIFSTAWQFSSQPADGRPDCGSSSRLLLPQRNSAASAWPWHMMAHLHRTQQSFGCISAAAEVLQCQIFYHCTIADFVKISHIVQPTTFNILNLEKSNKQKKIRQVKGTGTELILQRRTNKVRLIHRLGCIEISAVYIIVWCIVLNFIASIC